GRDRDVDRPRLPGHAQAPQVHGRPRHARLHHARPAGLDRRLGVSVARHQGQASAGPHGRRARDHEEPEGGRHRRGAVDPRRAGLRPRQSGALGRIRTVASAKGYAADGTAKGNVELPAALFDQQVNEHLLYQAVRTFLTNQRQGTAKVKSRVEVSGGGRKPWKQKGTGRARSGSNTSPVWVGGGRAHGPEPHAYHLDLPKKQRRLALTSALSLKAREAKVAV